MVNFKKGNVLTVSKGILVANHLTTALYVEIVYIRNLYIRKILFMILICRSVKNT